MVSGSLSRKHIHPKASKTSEDPTPPRLARTFTLHHRHIATRGTTQVDHLPQIIHSVHSNIGTSPKPSISLSLVPKKVVLLFSLSVQGASQPIADIHSAHMLTSDNSVKYQCICCPGDVPKTSCTIQTNHSLFFSFYQFFFFFVCVYVHLNQKTSSPSMILYSCCNRQPSERLSPKRGLAGTGFQYGAKRHALAGTHPRHSGLGQFNQETGRETAFVSCFFVFSS